MGIFTKTKRIPEISFDLERDFEREIFDNYKLLFGENTILIDAKKKIGGEAFGRAIPDGFLFDFSDKEEPKFYLIEVELAAHDFFNHIFPQITKFFGFFRNHEQRSKLVEKLHDIINTSNEMKNDFKSLIGGNEIFKSVNDLIENSQNILIVIDGEKPEFSEIGETYSDTWGKMVQCVIMKKYSEGNGGETVFQLEPDLEILNAVGDEKVSNKETTGYDEEHHTKGINQEIVDIYTELKGKVLEINPKLVFNPTKFYISIKGRRNCAFISFSKKKMKLTPMRPEEEIRKCVSEKYRVRSLPPSVQKFWNGECARIFIEDSSGMAELIEVLKPLISEDNR